MAIEIVIYPVMFKPGTNPKIIAMATIDNILPRDYSHRDLQSASFKNEDLRKANFSGSDLRGADFSNADLTGADLTHVRTGIKTVNVVVLFIAALVISMLSGYLSMRAGEAIQVMLQSEDNKIRYAGIATIVIILGFIVYAWWKGGGNAIRNLIIPVIGVATLLGSHWIFVRSRYWHRDVLPGTHSVTGSSNVYCRNNCANSCWFNVKHPLFGSGIIRWNVCEEFGRRDRHFHHSRCMHADQQKGTQRR